MIPLAVPASAAASVNVTVSFPAPVTNVEPAFAFVIVRSFLPSPKLTANVVVAPFIVTLSSPAPKTISCSTAVVVLPVEVNSIFPVDDEVIDFASVTVLNLISFVPFNTKSDLFTSNATVTSNLEPLASIITSSKFLAAPKFNVSAVTAFFSSPLSIVANFAVPFPAVPALSIVTILVWFVF